MNNELILRIILDIIIICVGLYIVLWKSYLREKGKNFATKEDIEEITKKIETVKNEIGIHSQLKLEYLKDRKKAALDFLSSISLWLDFALRPLGIIQNNPIDKKLLSELIADLKNKGSVATLNYWNMFVYFNDEKFDNVLDKLYDSCIELHNLTNEMLLNIERKAIKANRRIEIFELVRNKEEKAEISIELEKINKEINEIIGKYIKERKEIDLNSSTNRLEYIILLNNEMKIKIPNNNKDFNN